MISDSPAQADIPDGMSSGLRISEVRIQDLRGIRDLCVPLNDLTVLVGENNVGKSTFLRALELALGGGSTRAIDDDLHVLEGGERVPTFMVDVKVSPGSDKEFDSGVAVRFGEAVRLPEGGSNYVNLRTIGNATRDGSGPSLERWFVDGWECQRDAAMSLDVLPRRPRADDLELLTFFLLDARRDMVEELRQRRSYWGRLMSDVSIKPEDKKELEARLKELGNDIVAGSAVLASIRTELLRLGDALGEAASDVSVEALPGRIDEVARAVDVLLKAPGSASLPLRLQGMGARSLAVAMVFQAYTGLRLGREQEIPPLPFIGLEEPEAHLHPHPQRAMFKIIEAMTGQKIISTHSPYVTQVADIFDLRVFTRTGSTISCKFVPKEKPDGTDTFSPDELEKVHRFVQRNNGEVLFARCVVLLEGDTEEGVVPILARARWGRDPSAKGVSLVGVGGSGNFQHFAFVLEELGIPWFIFSDGDEPGRKGVAKAGKRLGRSLDSSSPEVVMLTPDSDFEKYLVDQGFRPALEKAVEGIHGSGALKDYKTDLDGKKGRGGSIRDYQSAGWEDRLILDYSRERLKGFGVAVAEKIAGGKIPDAITELLDRVDRVIGAAH